MANETHLRDIEVQETVQKSLKVVEGNDVEIYRGDDVIASEGGAARLYLKVLFEIHKAGLPSGSKVALLGGGTAILPRLLPNLTFYIFELYQEIADWTQTKHGNIGTWVIGDWKETLENVDETFDAAIFDTLEELDDDSLSLIKSKVVKDGSIFKVVP